jgi:uncharacterized Zn-binding protein involved in type VI secretion
MAAAKQSKTRSARKPANKAAKMVKKATKGAARVSSRRNVRATATKAQKGARRVGDLGKAVVTAGEMIQEGAKVAETLAVNIKKRTR